MSEVITVELQDDSAAPEMSVTDSEVRRKAEFDEEDSGDEEIKEQPSDYAEQKSQTDSAKENEPNNATASPSPANASATASQTSESEPASNANPRSSVMSSASSSRRSSSTGLATGTGVYRSHWSVHADLDIKAHSFLPKKPMTAEKSRTMPAIAASAMATRAISTRIGVNVKAEREKYERLRKAREAAEKEENERKTSTGVAVKRPGTTATASFALMGEKGVVQPRVTHKGHLVGLASDDSELLVRRGVHPDAASMPLVGVDDSLAQTEATNGEIGQGSVSWARMGSKGRLNIPALALQSKTGHVSNSGAKSARGVLSRNQGSSAALSHAGIMSSSSATEGSRGTLTEHGRATGMAGMGGSSRGPFASRMQSDTGAALSRGVRASSAAHSGKVSESALSDPNSIDSIQKMATPRGGKASSAAIVGVISPRGNLGRSTASHGDDSSAQSSTLNGASADASGISSEVKMNGRVPSLRISSDITNSSSSEARSSRSARGQAQTTQAIPEETIQQRILRSQSMARLAEAKARSHRPSRPPLSHSMSHIALNSARSSSSGGPNSARGRISASPSTVSLNSEKRRSMPHPLALPATTGHRTRTGLWTTEPIREPSATN